MRIVFVSFNTFNPLYSDWNIFALEFVFHFTKKSPLLVLILMALLMHPPTIEDSPLTVIVVFKALPSCVIILLLISDGIIAQK
jgi:hypothetical protein